MANGGQNRRKLKAVLHQKPMQDRTENRHQTPDFTASAARQDKERCGLAVPLCLLLRIGAQFLKPFDQRMADISAIRPVKAAIG